jgi:hypothetical protein
MAGCRGRDLSPDSRRTKRPSRVDTSTQRSWTDHLLIREVCAVVKYGLANVPTLMQRQCTQMQWYGGRQRQTRRKQPPLMNATSRTNADAKATQCTQERANEFHASQPDPSCLRVWEWRLIYAQNTINIWYWESINSINKVVLTRFRVELSYLNDRRLLLWYIQKLTSKKKEN